MIKKFAHIVDGVIVDTILADDAFVQAHPLDWLECPEQYGIGHLCDVATGTYSYPPAPPPPPAPRTVTRETFLRLLTQAERIAMRTAAKTDVYMEDFMALLDAATEVNKDDPDVSLGLQYSESKGYIALGRTAEILA